MRALVCAGLCVWLGWVGDARAESPALTELRELAAAWPDDSDLAWALAGELEASGDKAAAAAELRRLVERWPGRQPGAWLRLGRLLVELDEHELAIDSLEAASIEAPLDGTAHFYRGLSLRAIGRHGEAARALQVAARLEPELDAEARLLSALSQLQLGHSGRANELLAEVLELQPTGETARQARLLLGSPQPASLPSQRPLALFASGGVEFDSNLTLEGDVVPGGLSTDRSDVRAVWGAGLAWRAHQGRRTRATLGFRYNESSHGKLREFDLQSHVLFASAELEASSRVLLRLDGFATDQHLDGDRYARTWTVRPTLLLAHGERTGLSRLYFELERSRYHNDPLLPSLDLDATATAFALEHYLPLGGWDEAWGSAGLRYRHVETEGSRDFLGFNSAYDRSGLQTTLRLVFPLAWSLQARAEASYEYERYRYRNLIDALFESGLTDAKRRRDHVAEATVSLARPLTEHTKIELRWRGTLAHSNVDTYSYDRSIVGLYFRVETF